MKKELPKIDWQRADTLIRLALEEDLCGRGDTTSISVIPETTVAAARFVSRENCVCAGIELARRVFMALDSRILWKPLAEDGDFVLAGGFLAEVSGPARTLLTAERTSLNFLQRLCGVATMARLYSEAAQKGGKAIILDTRKTTPGWRNLEKYAVAAGGAGNHRIGLYDRIMIKDNHRELAGFEGTDGIRRSVERARGSYPDLEVEVEADTLDDVREGLAAGADYILLDNMDNATMSEAVRIVAGRAKLEASGGITLERVPSISALGVDFISVGALTHSVKSIDISMEILPQTA
ncbi:MAG: nicotinate-nucleotide diphosphorylase (carboxylating) [Lentisphaerae bacterium GWF2_52_8]|nr:MAG: nicotinate-nucleotide diphosphorylase (carboxylating) [Lentisphaerae bacterium GWF2_52_8]